MYIYIYVCVCVCPKCLHPVYHQKIIHVCLNTSGDNMSLRVTSEVFPRIRPVLHHNQLAAKPPEKLRSERHLLTATTPRHQCCPSSHPRLSGYWVCYKGPLALEA